MKIKSGLLLPIAFIPVAFSTACFLDGGFNERKQPWDFTKFKNIKDAKNVAIDSVKISFKNNPSQQYKLEVIKPEVDEVADDKAKAIEFINRYFVISMIVTRPHNGWDAGNNYSHIHNEIVTDATKKHEKVLDFEFNLHKKPKFINIKDNVISFDLELANKIFDHENKEEPLYYLHKTFTINLEG